MWNKQQNHFKNIYLKSEIKILFRLITASKQIPHGFDYMYLFFFLLWLINHKPKITNIWRTTCSVCTPFHTFSFDFSSSWNTHKNWFETWFHKRSLNFLSKHTCFNCVKQWSQAEIGVIHRRPSITLKREKNLKRF